MIISTDPVPKPTSSRGTWLECAAVTGILLVVLAAVVLLLVSLGGDQSPQPTAPMPSEGTLTGGGL